MLLLRKSAYARAGLIGNPSDGYNGKTISISVRNYKAEVVLYEWENVELVRTKLDENRFDSVHDLIRDVELHGYYGGMRLLKATIKKFVEYCLRQGHGLHDRNFSIRYDSNIPRQVGMAGSSAIIVAALRCLMEFYGVNIPREVQPSLVLSVEKSELGIAAGLQDRVIQVYEGLVYMDFSEGVMHEADGYLVGNYEPLEGMELPPIYIAYNVNVSEPTEVFHNDIRGRYERGDQKVIDAMKKCAELAEQARAAILNGDFQELGRLIDENFNTRRSIYKLPPDQVKMVEVAREVGATAKFAGSGGAIIGTFEDESMFAKLQKALEPIGCKVIQPKIKD